MNDRHPLEDIWLRFADGEVLSAEENEAILTAMTTDEELRRRLLRDEFMDGLLTTLARSQGSEAVFVDQVLRRMGAEVESDGFAERVTRELERGKARWEGRRRFAVAGALAAGIMVAVGVWRFGTVGAKIDDSVVETGKGQITALQFDGEDTLVEMAENTKLRVVGGAVASAGTPNVEVVKVGLGKVIELESGSIKVSVAKQTDGRSFAVRSEQAEMRVVGTKFSVGVGVDRKQTRLNVQEGVVQLASRDSGHAVHVRPGASAIVEAGKGIEFGGKSIQMAGRVQISDEVGAPVPKSSYRACLGFDGKLLWFAHPGTAILYGVEPDTGSIVQKIDLTGHCSSFASIACGTESLWIVGCDPEGKCHLFRVRLSNGSPEASPVAPASWGNSVACGGGQVWIGQRRQGSDEKYVISRVDPSTGKALSQITTRIPVPPDQRIPSLMWFDGGLWVACERIHRIDSNSGKVLITAAAETGGGRGILIPAGGEEGRVWALQYPGRTVYKFDALFTGEGRR